MESVFNKPLDEEVKDLNGNLASLGIKTKAVSNSSAISAGGFLEVDTAYAPSGFKVLGVVGYQVTGSNNGAFACNRAFYASGKITATFRNVSSSSATPGGITFYMLCIAS